MKALQQRKDQDPTRKRRNFKKHLQMIQPQKMYFEFIKNHTNIPVLFMSYKAVESTKIILLERLSILQLPVVDQLLSFEKIIKYLGKNNSH